MGACDQCGSPCDRENALCDRCIDRMTDQYLTAMAAEQARKDKL